LESSFLDSLSVGVIDFSGSEPKLLSLVEDTEALGVLVESSERPALVIRLDTFHLNHLGAGQHVRELDWASAFLLVLDDFGDVLFH
jgi:hypothetical protein